MPNGSKPTREQIMADYEAAMDALGEIEHACQDGIDEIEGSEPPLSDAQKADRDALVAAQRKSRAAMTKVAWATLEKLNEMNEVKRLKAAFDSVNAGLNETREKVEHIEEVAATVEKALAAIAKVAAKLAKFLA